MKARSILIVEDEHALGSALALLVRRMGHLPTMVASGQSALKALGECRFDAIVLDIGLPDMSGIEVLESLRQSRGRLPALVMTAHATLRHAIDSQKSGATAYLTKPLDMKQFQQTLGSMLLPPVEIASPPAEAMSPPESPTLIGGAPSLNETFIGIARACAGNFPVMIQGPSGSGKSLAAHVIHAHGKPSGDPLVEHSCSRIGDESVFTQASHGSLVLHEITELAPELQQSLATWLASSSEPRARIIATTTHDPLQAVRDGRLREELYYALSALVIPLPPLAERSGDIPALCAFFANLMHVGVAPVISLPVIEAMQAYHWPGNVRELRHVVEYALSMSQGGAVYLSHLPTHVAESSGHIDRSDLLPGEFESVIKRWIDASLAHADEHRPSYDEMLQRIESQMLAHLMEIHEHRPTRLASAMRLHRGTLRQKLQRAGLSRKED